MFNWYSLPTFVAMLLFCALASYILTRSPRGLLSLTAVATQVVAAAYLLGQGMLANAATLEEWGSWARTTQWGIVIALVLWYWLTVLLLKQQNAAVAHRSLRWIGYPLGVLLALTGLALVVAIYSGDWLYVWSAPTHLSPAQSTYFRYRVPVGPLYGGFVALVWASTLGAAFNVWLGWRTSLDERRRHFGWLLAGALLFALGIGPTAVANWLDLYAWPTWLGHLAVVLAMVLMAANVAAFQLVVEGPVIRTDLVYYLTALASICLLYVVVFVVAAPAYSFRILGLLALTMILVTVSHALIGPARLAFDRLFYGDDVSRLRSSLNTLARDAVLTRDLESVVTQAQSDLADISDEHFFHLVEEALRRLNNPAALARCKLITQIPRSLAGANVHPGASGETLATPLELARRLRDVLIAGIEQLKPGDRDVRRGDPGALQYTILHDEYVLGMPNKQIMTRHGVGEGTFHRHRREAIAILSRELRTREERLERGDDRGGASPHPRRPPFTTAGGEGELRLPSPSPMERGGG